MRKYFYLEIREIISDSDKQNHGFVSNEVLESKGSFGGGKSDFLNGSFAGRAGIASLGSLPCFTGSIFSDWLNIVGSCRDIVFNGVNGTGEPVEFLEHLLFLKDTIYFVSSIGDGTEDG